jgi:hypothetical protein
MMETIEMKRRFQAAMAAFVTLGLLAAYTLDGKIRLATLIFLAGLAVRTAIHYLARGDAE